MEGESLFDVQIEPAHGGRWRVGITTNGSQWQTLSQVIRDRSRALRIRDFLLAELAEDAALDDAEIHALVRGGSRS